MLYSYVDAFFSKVLFVLALCRTCDRTLTFQNCGSQAVGAPGRQLIYFILFFICFQSSCGCSRQTIACTLSKMPKQEMTSSAHITGRQSLICFVFEWALFSCLSCVDCVRTRAPTAGRQTFSKVLCVVAFFSTCTMALTFSESVADVQDVWC